MPLAAVTAAASAGVLPLVSGAAAATTGPHGLRLSRVAGSVVRSATVPLTAGTTTLPTTSFGLVGFTWRGRTPSIRFRTHAGAAWTGWTGVHPLADGPDHGTTESRAMPPGASEGTWVGASVGIEVETDRPVTMVLVDPGIVAGDLAARRGPDGRLARPSRRRTSRRHTPGKHHHHKRKDGLARPAMYWRKEWGADETWRSSAPRYCTELQQVHIHHTATSNDYAPGDVPGLIRAFYWYHTHALGWSDIGYNFLIDRWGRIWAGRAGGVSRLVRGAHTLGFNATSVGIAVIGNYDLVAPAPAVLKSLARMAAWKLHQAGLNASARAHVTSEGSDLFPVGEVVILPRIDGHRDTNQTACPGSQLYAQIPVVRRRAQNRITYYTT